MTIGEIAGLMLLIFIICGAYFEGWRRGYKEREKLEEQEE